MKDEAVCPYCGHQESNSWEFGGGREGEFEFTCNACNREYRLRRDFAVYYTSTPK